MALLQRLVQLDLRRPLPGLLLAAFMVGYGAARSLVDLTRVRLSFWTTADPWLALAMALAGGAVLFVIVRQHRLPGIRSERG